MKKHTIELTDVDNATDLVRQVHAKLAGPQTVWVLISEAGNETHVSVYADRELAAAGLFQCLDEYDEGSSRGQDAAAAQADLSATNGDFFCTIGENDWYSLYEETVHSR